MYYVDIFYHKNNYGEIIQNIKIAILPDQAMEHYTT